MEERLEWHISQSTASATAALEAALTAGDAAAACAAADRLLGLGPGLTPSGDDVLAGLLVAAALLPRPIDQLATHVAERAGTATTALAASLLCAAARGEACPELVAFVDALGGHGAVGPAYRRLARIGHTSGRDMAAGVLVASRVAAVHAGAVVA
jgi:hypothetical protein